ncbi:hypothetical protein DFH06DRAFT_1178711 [Mycena polygramma]|nr:hypothetical protein DFH06DRAFT_1178711 [Mycena polygramma]
MLCIILSLSLSLSLIATYSRTGLLLLLSFLLPPLSTTLEIRLLSDSEAFIPFRIRWGWYPKAKYCKSVTYFVFVSFSALKL